MPYQCWKCQQHFDNNDQIQIIIGKGYLRNFCINCYVRPKGLVRSKGFSSNHKRLLYQFLCERDGNRCQMCHKLLDKNTATIDHNVPISRGGDHRLDNLYLMCSPCNTAKRSKEWKDIKLPYSNRLRGLITKGFFKSINEAKQYRTQQEIPIGDLALAELWRRHHVHLSG